MFLNPEFRIYECYQYSAQHFHAQKIFFTEKHEKLVALALKLTLTSTLTLKGI